MSYFDYRVFIYKPAQTDQSIPQTQVAISTCMESLAEIMDDLFIEKGLSVDDGVLVIRTPETKEILGVAEDRETLDCLRTNLETLITIVIKRYLDKHK